MIFLQEIFDELAYGEFANMNVGQSVNGSIKADSYPRLLNAVNAALTELHIRFSLKREEFLLYQRTDVSKYILDLSHDGTPGETTNPDIYLEGLGPIFDTGKRIVKLIEAFDTADDKRIHINDRNYPNDIFMPDYRTLKFTPRDPLAIVSIVFQTTHTPIKLSENFNPATVEIDIPSFLITPIIPYVVSRWFTGKTSKKGEGEVDLRNTFMHKFEVACQQIIKENLVTNEQPEDERFENNGWC